MVFQRHQQTRLRVVEGSEVYWLIVYAQFTKIEVWSSDARHKSAIDGWETISLPAQRHRVIAPIAIPTQTQKVLFRRRQLKQSLLRPGGRFIFLE